MKTIRNFDKKLFEKQRRPWLLVGLVPSFFLDIFAIIVMVLSYLNGEISFGESLKIIIMFIVGNAFVYKGVMIYYYFRLKDIRSRGYLEIDDVRIKYVSYSMRIGARADDSVGTYFFNEYKVEGAELNENEKTGASIIKGKILVSRYEENLDLDKTTLLWEKEKGEVKVPGYYRCQ